MKSMTWLECMTRTAQHLNQFLLACEGDPNEPSENEAKALYIEIVSIREYLADAPPSFTSSLELDRRAYRAEAEVARLRELLTRVADALYAVPDPSLRDLELIAEARRG